MEKFTYDDDRHFDGVLTYITVRSPMSVNLSGETVQKEVKIILEQCLSDMTEIDTLKSGIKDNLGSLKEKYALEPKIVRKALKVLHDKNLAEVQQLTNDVESLVAIAENVKI